jgi:hypothetical protein
MDVQKAGRPRELLFANDLLQFLEQIIAMLGQYLDVVVHVVDLGSDSTDDPIAIALRDVGLPR